MTTRPAGTRRLAPLRLAPPLLLLAHLLLLADGARRDSATFDEPLFLAGGIASWHGAHHLLPEGGALPQRLAGLPLVLAGVELPRDDERWREADGSSLGSSLLDSPLASRRLLFLARLPILLASVGLGWMLHALASRLIGEGAALVALALFAFSPGFLAHGRLATADLLAAATLPASAWLAHRCLQRVGLASLAASSAVLALAVLAKFSAILLPPVIALVVLARLLAGAPTRWRDRSLAAGSARWLAALGVLAVVHALVAAGAVWLAHDLRWGAAPPDARVEMKEGGWAAVDRAGPTAGLVRALRDARLLPEAWLHGLQYTMHHAQARRAYAEGRYSLEGWWWFFPRVLALKVPLATLALLPLGLAAFASSWRRGEPLLRGDPEDEPRAPWARRPWARDVVEAAPLLGFAGVYGIAAVASHLNLGFRHLLPVLPVALLLAAASWRLAGRVRGMRHLVPALAVVSALEALPSHPDHLAWMNLAGGSEERRWTHLVDSSLDWGQGLREAAAVVARERRPDEVVHLSWFGWTDPVASEGLAARGLRGYPDAWRLPSARLPEEGLHLISATMLVQLTSPTCPGAWRPAYEAAWRGRVAEVERFRKASPAEREAMLAGPEGAAWRVAVAEHDDLATARLCAFLRHREPLRAIAGGAMLLHRLDAREVEEALFGEPVELAGGPPPFPIVPYEVVAP